MTVPPAAPAAAPAPGARGGFRTAEAPARAALLSCVHCGLCLNACPTYRDTRHEGDSPRGRVYLMRAVQEGRLDFTPDVVRHIDSCIGCRACETVCPAGVDYGHLLEATRAEIGARVRRPWWQQLADDAGHAVLARPRWLRVATVLTHLYVRSGLRRLARASGLLRVLPRPLRIAEEMLPESIGVAPALRVAPPLPADAPVIGLLRTCAMDLALPGVHAATRSACAAVGLRVVEPATGVCCGALHQHAGRLDEARALARATIAAFEATGVDLIATNSAGCGSAMKDYGHLLRDDPAWAARATAFAGRVRDIAEILAPRVEARPPAATGRRVRVVYQEPGHLAHAQRVRQPPRRLLAALPDVDMVELAHPDWCCGSGGVYNLRQPDRGERLLANKIADVRAAGPEAVAVGNPGCLLHIGRGVRQAGLPARVVHPVELVAEAYAAAARG